MRDMYDQPKYKPLASSPLWPDGSASRSAVDDTVARSEGSFAGASSGRQGTTTPTKRSVDMRKAEDTATAARADHSAEPSLAGHALTRAVLQRGRDRFDIFCAPCHSVSGDGDGLVARRGFPHPPSFHLQRLREATNGYLYSVISEGHGDMYSYAAQIDPPDRMAIVAYIRALQRSQHATMADVPREKRTQLDTKQ